LPVVPDLRATAPNDAAALDRLYPAAFPEEDLRLLVRSLLKTPGVLSLVACEGGEIIGHAAFSPCSVAGRPVALLGPVAVSPTQQHQGVGSALIRRGLDELARAGVAQVQVLGDPAYYRRFGFRADADVRPPYPLPEAWTPAWQSLRLGEDPAGRGVLDVPAPWQDPAVWG
jgi:putative acetyltransferase